MTTNDVSKTPLDLPEKGMDTPYGYLYRPLGSVGQFFVLLASFVGGPLFAYGIGLVPGDLSEAAQTLLFIPFVLIFFMGYSLWVARLKAIAFDTIGKSLLKTLFLLIVKKQKPATLQDVMPDKDKLLQMAVKGQKAGASFTLVAWPIAIIAGLCALLMETAFGLSAMFVLVTGSCLTWGYCLGYCGRRGWLPIMEEA